MTSLDAPTADHALRLEGGDEALLSLLSQLRGAGYQFITPTPATHARVLQRPTRREADNLRDVLGWSLAFDPSILDQQILKTLIAADALETLKDGRLRSRYRVSCLDDQLFLHSAYPTEAEDAVFFGPDSYRFANVIRRELSKAPPAPDTHLVDVGAGAGVGAIVAARLYPELRVTMTDINPAALHLAQINAATVGIQASYVLSSDLAHVDQPIDIALANPPYIIDDAGRDYRDGGDMHGARVALDMATAAVERLSAKGRLILYTGSAIVDGDDALLKALRKLAQEQGCTLRYREIDPDVFGEELAKPAYADVDRIAIVGAVIERRG